MILLFIYILLSIIYLTHILYDYTRCIRMYLIVDHLLLPLNNLKRPVDPVWQRVFDMPLPRGY